MTKTQMPQHYYFDKNNGEYERKSGKSYKQVSLLKHRIFLTISLHACIPGEKSVDKVSPTG
jgi:hypothetical protein